MSDIEKYFGEGWAAVLMIPEEWREEVYSLHEFIKLLDIPGYRIEQVKEKFGGLRYYCSFDYDAIVDDLYGPLEDRIKVAEGAIRYVEWKLK